MRQRTSIREAGRFVVDARERLPAQAAELGLCIDRTVWVREAKKRFVGALTEKLRRASPALDPE
jgi:hypothetical protein